MTTANKLMDADGAGSDFLKTVLIKYSPLRCQSEFLNYELDTKVFRGDFSCFVGEINGRGLASLDYEMPEM